MVEAGQASIDGNVATTAVWTALVAAMILAAATARGDEYVDRLFGGRRQGVDTGD